MVYFILLAVVLLFIGVILLVYDYDTQGIFLIGSSVTIPFLALIFICLIIDDASTKTQYHIVYEEGKLKNVESSDYGLVVTNRRYYSTFDSGCVEYNLYDNFGNNLLNCYSKEELIEYFNPLNDNLFGE